jgi:hypothetical protein
VNGSEEAHSAAPFDAESEVETATEERVMEAFNTVKFFEQTHCLNLQVRRART